jgi:thiol-disulfide isomerase/thioredoxin
MKQLRGKVILVDFWTYDCINCINTLSHVVRWHDKYKDKGLVVIGVHTPEYAFERKTENVRTALKRFDIRYPVAQDNRYATWNAYNNRYWPAFYLVNKKGQVVYTHFGEGQYEQTEARIQQLLAQTE